MSGAPESAPPPPAWNPPGGATERALARTDAHSRALASVGLPLSDYGNARRIVETFGAEMRFTGATGWHVWDLKRWALDQTGRAERRAKRAAIAIYDEAKEAGVSEKAQDLSKWALKSQKQGALESALKCASSEKEVRVLKEDFDKDPWILNVGNGILDLKTTVLTPHDPARMLTKLAPVPFDSDAQCPLWDSFLKKFLPDEEVRAFFQRYMGSCLSGDTSEQALVILYGPGGNGKSTAIETVTEILGDYFVGTPFSTLTMSRDNGGATNDLASLAGARLVVAGEPPEGTRLNTATVKHLTGGDTITARMLYKEFFSYRPQFKLVLVTNHRPQIEESTHAIWRRVFLIPFDVTILDSERDEKFREKLLAERAGILRWLVQGCCDWQIKEGLHPPEKVAAATKEYRAEEDSFGTFVEECCTIGVPGVDSRASLILNAYNHWAKDNGLDPISVKSLSGKLREKGLTSRKSDGVMLWSKIGLKGAPVDQPTDRSSREDREDRDRFY